MRIAHNQETGERMIDVNGQWLPVEKTAVNQDGAEAYFAGGEWHVDDPVQPPPVMDDADEGRSIPAELARQAALTGRYLVGGPAKALTGINDAFTSAVDETSRLLGSDFRMGSASQYVDPALDAAGFPRPEGRAEERIGTVSEFTSGSAVPISAGVRLSNSASRVPAAVGDILQQNRLMQAASSAAGGAGLEAGRDAELGPGGQMMASIGASFIPSTAAVVGPAATRLAFRGPGMEQIRSNISNFEGAGTQPSVGQATQNRVVQAGESALSRTPGGAGRMVRFAEQQADDVGATVDDVANSLAQKASPERVGIEVERGILGDDGFIARFNAKSGQLYDEVDPYIDPQQPMSVQNTMRVLKTPTTLKKGAPRTASKLQSSYLEELGVTLSDDVADYMNSTGLAATHRGPGLPYAVVKELRTAVGERMSNMGMIVDASQRQIKALYAALSEDLLIAARRSGPEAERAARRANNYHRAGMNRIERLGRVLNKHGGPEKVFTSIMSGTKEGATVLRTVLKSLKPDERKWVTSAVIRRMGRATPGKQDAGGEQFSLETYLTNWNRLSPEAKGVLLSGRGDVIKATEHVAKVAENVREGSRVFANPSGTGQAVFQQGLWMGGGASALLGNFPALAAFASVPIAANLGARLMTNQNFVHWLARTTQLPQGATGAAINELTQLAARDDEIAEFYAMLQEQQVDQ